MFPKRLWSSLFRSSPGSAANRDEAHALAQIESWTSPFSGPVPVTPVHVLTCNRDWRLAAWMLASWFHFTERAWSVVIHDDGTLTGEAAAALQRIIPTARIIRRKEADAALAPVLREYPFGETFRSDHPSALKIFDARHYAGASRFFVFDSDVLFFKYPRELVDWAFEGDAGCWFSEGAEERSLLSSAVAGDELGVKVWPRVDTGVCLWRQAALDLHFIDGALAQTRILHGSLDRAAQTLAMLCAARAGAGGLLPSSYEVSDARSSGAESVCRHYTGASRERFFDEGLKRVAPHLFASDRPPR